jgi:hypothetical protein
MSHVYFPPTNFISQIFTIDERDGDKRYRVEVGLVGAEGTWVVR